MAAPLVTFKAGRCEYDPESGATVKPEATPGYVYITEEDDLNHFCWRPRSAPHTQPSLDLIMPPSDATFKPYRPANAKSAIAGRIYVLKFSSSSDRHFFWLQSTGKPSNPSEFSSRDLKIGEIVNAILQGEEVDVTGELRNLPSGGNGDSGDEDDDTAMEDADGPGPGGLRRAVSGGAGAGATGGDVREEGEEAREGGADGGRASSSGNTTDQTQTAITAFLRSLNSSTIPQQNLLHQQQDPFTTLPDLLPTTTTLPLLSTLPTTKLDTLLSHLPPAIILLTAGMTPSEINTFESELDGESDAETLSAISMSLSDDQKREVLAKVLRAPQFHQALASLTHALRDGGLPMIAEALKVGVENRGLVTGGNVPVGGGAAVRVFVEGIKNGVRKTADGEEADVEME